MSHLIPVSLANQAVAECEKVIAGLMEDNKRLKEQLQEMEQLAKDNLKEYDKLYAKNKQLIETYEAIKKLVP